MGRFVPLPRGNRSITMIPRFPPLTRPPWGQQLSNFGISQTDPYPPARGENPTPRFAPGSPWPSRGPISTTRPFAPN